MLELSLKIDDDDHILPTTARRRRCRRSINVCRNTRDIYCRQSVIYIYIYVDMIYTCYTPSCAGPPYNIAVPASAAAKSDGPGRKTSAGERETGFGRTRVIHAPFDCKQITYTRTHHLPRILDLTEGTGRRRCTTYAGAG